MFGSFLGVQVNIFVHRMLMEYFASLDSNTAVSSHPAHPLDAVTASD
jgi:hypothetical protein